MVAYSFKKRFIAPIQVGLGIYRGEPETALRAAWPAAKRQTIRADGRRRHACPGDLLQLYTAMRTKQCEKIGEARCTISKNITLRICNDGDLLVTIDRRMLSDRDRDAFALCDGFGSVEDMWLFWRKEHPGIEYFNGVLIQWEPL